MDRTGIYLLKIWMVRIQALDSANLFKRMDRERRSAISPIIATLLLILIAIGAGVLVYAYVVGFIGNTTQNNGSNPVPISIDYFCASNSGKCNANGLSNQAYVIVIRNAGSSNIATGTVQIYLTDITSGATGSATCQISSSVAPGSTYTCSSNGPTWPSGTTQPALGDTLSIKVVNPDGGQATSSVKVVA